MFRYAAHPSVSPTSAVPFLDDARRNLRLLRQTYGARSLHYRRLLAHYRVVADELDCRPAFEEALRALQRCSPLTESGDSSPGGET